MNPGSLTIVGTGLYAAGHATPDALAQIEGAEKLFHLVVDPVSRSWLEGLNPTAESLFDSYADGKPRRESYDEMVARMLAPMRLGREVCVALYGHPGVLVDPSHAAIGRARAEGHRARMLPGISSEDCLFADLGIDPAAGGCQSFEATDFLVRRRRFDPETPLILWQIGAVGVTTFRNVELWSEEGLQALTQELRLHYPARHPVVVYEAPRFAISEPSIQDVPLENLGRARVSTSSTLYVPPLGATEPFLVKPGPELPTRSNGLSVVGTGYAVAGHVNLETEICLERAERLFYLATDPATSAWLRTVNPRAESLHDCYRAGVSGTSVTRQIVERILASLEEGREVCVAFSGHPAIGMPPAHQALRQARERGHPARMLPAISFEDCLFADLGLDPGDDGRLLYDARDLLRRHPVLETSSALLLVQAGVVGWETYREGAEPNREGLALLAQELERLYPGDHEVLLYDIPDFPIFEPAIERLRLCDLADSPATIRSTLYVPPLTRAEKDPIVAERLERASVSSSTH